jgi:hypothetical protein
LRFYFKTTAAFSIDAEKGVYYKIEINVPTEVSAVPSIFGTDFTASSMFASCQEAVQYSNTVLGTEMKLASLSWEFLEDSAFS